MIKECMNTEVYVVTPQETIARARNLMLKHGIGRLIVPLTILHEASAAQAAEMMLENSISGMPVVKEENGREKLVSIDITPSTMCYTKWKRIWSAQWL